MTKQEIRVELSNLHKIYEKNKELEAILKTIDELTQRQATYNQENLIK